MAASKLEFLRRVMCLRDSGGVEDPLTTQDTYVRDNVRIAAQALHLRLIRLVRPMGEFSYELQATPGGEMLVSGHLVEAAASIDSGSTITRITGSPPCGPVGLRLPPGGKGVTLHSGWARANAGEILRGIATSHLMVEGDTVVARRLRYMVIPTAEAHSPLRVRGSGRTWAEPVRVVRPG